jgi:mannose-6-phosphate isomerase-like protein (cupin superfamily)
VTAAVPPWSARIADALARLPGPPGALWPEGERFVTMLRHGSLSLELYAPRGHDPQQPHERDELYVVVGGHGRFERGDGEACERVPFGPGDVLFVPAGCPHRFVDFSADFAVWVVFYGPLGGEAARATLTVAHPRETLR